MKNHVRIIGLAFGVILAPIAAFAQDTGLAGSGLNGSATSPDGTAPDITANPFTGAAGANTFYQDNSLTGSAPSSNPATTGSAAMGNSSGLGANLGDSNPAGPVPTPGESSAADSANPFADAAGASKFYQDNSLTGSMSTTNLGSLGGIDSGAASWATTP